MSDNDLCELNNEVRLVYHLIAEASLSLDFLGSDPLVVICFFHVVVSKGNFSASFTIF